MYTLINNSKKESLNNHMAMSSKAQSWIKHFFFILLDCASATFKFNCYAYKYGVKMQMLVNFHNSKIEALNTLQGKFLKFEDKFFSDQNQYLCYLSAFFINNFTFL